ncbi:MAG: hypothetical protein ACOC7K_02035 [bacterium]
MFNPSFVDICGTGDGFETSATTNSLTHGRLQLLKGASPVDPADNSGPQKRATGVFGESPAWEVMNSGTRVMDRRGGACLLE